MQPEIVDGLLVALEQLLRPVVGVDRRPEDVGRRAAVHSRAHADERMIGEDGEAVEDEERAQVHATPYGSDALLRRGDRVLRLVAALGDGEVARHDGDDAKGNHQRSDAHQPGPPVEDQPGDGESEEHAQPAAAREGEPERHGKEEYERGREPALPRGRRPDSGGDGEWQAGRQERGEHVRISEDRRKPIRLSKTTNQAVQAKEVRVEQRLQNGEDRGDEQDGQQGRDRDHRLPQVEADHPRQVEERHGVDREDHPGRGLGDGCPVHER